VKARTILFAIFWGAAVVHATASGDVDFRVIATTSLGGLTQQYTVVQSIDQWSALWKRMQLESGRRDPEPVPKVDFSRETLIVASAGSTGPGDQIAIQSIKAEDTVLQVSLMLMRMGPQCTSVIAPNSPLIAAVVPKTDALVSFFVVSAMRDCSKRVAEIDVSAAIAK
jgi:hypothetical protein